MKLSTKGRYAVMAMADLAQHSDGSPITLSEIAARQEISLAYLEQLFAKLRKRGLVESTRGPGGGYMLAVPADDIPISSIVVAVDEPLKVTRCATGKPNAGCVGARRCVTHDLWDELGRQIQLYLASVTLGDVVEGRIGGNRFIVDHPRTVRAEQKAAVI
jgi:Rrf2 family iron-sulfur cluster assembly transcriptional regulator